MDLLERQLNLSAIQELNACFAYHLDHDEVEPLIALFTPGAEYSNGTRQSCGRSEIEAFFRSRTAHGVRTSRHMYSGLRVIFDGLDRARATSVWLSFTQNALPPIEYSIPFLIADFEDTYERNEDGQWLIASRHIRPIFRDPHGTPFPERPRLANK